MFSGVVIRGDGIGNGLGYPTANMDVAPNETGLDEGVYAALATVGGKTYGAALLIDRSTGKVEVHLLDYAGGECYGATITIDPLARVSDIEKIFGEALVKKIARDVEQVRHICFPAS